VDSELRNSTDIQRLSKKIQWFGASGRAFRNTSSQLFVFEQSFCSALRQVALDETTSLQRRRKK
jgi:hypothetical protein